MIAVPPRWTVTALAVVLGAGLPVIGGDVLVLIHVLTSLQGIRFTAP
jgi:hypothetical protein